MTELSVGMNSVASCGNLSANPIFILGILRRSGTNYLSELLCMHPDCGAPSPIHEDYLMHRIDLLVEYSSSVSREWGPEWGIEGMENLLSRYLGNGLVSFLTSQTDGRCLVTKTPSIRNLGYFHKFLPCANLLILVRDGRAVVESGVKGFDWNYEKAIRAWADAARMILEFDQTYKGSDSKHLIVRYEDLYRNSEKELRRIFAFVGLDATIYDFENAANCPVKGSSVFRGPEAQMVHWKRVEKTSNFNPLMRWSHWNRALHERFNWIAGQQLTELGYTKKQYPTGGVLWTLWNRLMDLRWGVRELARSCLVGKLLRHYFRILRRQWMVPHLFDDNLYSEKLIKEQEKEA